MAIKPILFNTEMVRAITGGRKSVTRRLVKQDTDEILSSPYHKKHPEVEDKQIIEKLCVPPYKPEDILYVRETWAWNPCWDCELESKDCTKIRKDKEGEKGCYMYRAEFGDNEYPTADKWHPSIHMPKEAARIWLKVTDVRAERLQEITWQGAAEEGCQGSTGDEPDPLFHIQTLRGEFKRIWNSTIKKPDLNSYGWGANPWVWVIKFERCGKPNNG